MIFSLSGLSQESYGLIHGGTLDNVLSNFNYFYSHIRFYSPGTKIIIAWHRYKFNENEFWQAYKYFKRPGIYFVPRIAYLNDLLEMLEFCKGNLSEERMTHVEKDIFTDHIRERVTYHRAESRGYRCPGWDQLVMDETGNILQCCGTTSFDSKHIIGNILSMSAQEIWEKKEQDPVCKICIGLGVARWTYNQDIGGHRDYPWAPGRGLDFVKLKLHNYLHFNLKQNIRSLPGGEKIISRIKKIKRLFP